MQIETIAEMRLTADDDAQIAALLARAFDTEFGGRSYYRQRHHLRIVARTDGAVVAHVALCFRSIRMGASLVPIVGLADVATLAEWRGKGLASNLLQRAIGNAKGSLAEFLVLFGDQPLYARHGFLGVPNRLRFVVMDDAQTHGIKADTDAGLMMLPLRGGTWDASVDIDLLGHLF